MVPPAARIRPPIHHVPHLGAHGTSPTLGARIVIDAAVDRGLDARALCAAAGVPLEACLQRDARIPYPWVLAVWEAAMRMLDDPGFPVFAATRINPGSYDVPVFVCTTQPNLGAALHLAARYTRFWADTASWDVAFGAKEAVLTVRLDGGGADPDARLGVRCVRECSFVTLVLGARACTGVHVSPREARFSHPEPSDTSALEAALGATMRFSCPTTQIVFDARTMDLPLLKADPDMAAFFGSQMNALLAECEGQAPDGVSRKLRAALAEELPSGVPTLEKAASRLGLSGRTLRRRLAEENTTFLDVLERTRRELAKRYVGDPKLTFGEIAFLLGFSEPSAFHRAFKRWTGMTPLDHRKSGATGLAVTRGEHGLRHIKTGS